MDTETIGNKRFLIPIFLAILVIVAVVGYLYYRGTYYKPDEEIKPSQIPQELTENEKRAIQQSEELDKLREQYRTKETVPLINIIQNQSRSLDTIRNQAQKQKSVIVAIKKTPEQQSQELDALRKTALATNNTQ